MNEIAARYVNKILELHNYCINLFEEDDGARSALIRMLQSIAYAKSAHLSGVGPKQGPYEFKPAMSSQAPTTMCSLL
uniref:Uncharacterized protein n=1 Tax=Brassica oleracea var. oleracea TaxID=109376 RepID=A0A0D3DFZ7_BRAOL